MRGGPLGHGPDTRSVFYLRALRFMLFPVLVGIPSLVLFITAFNGASLSEAFKAAGNALFSAASLKEFWPFIVFTAVAVHWYLLPVVNFFCSCTTGHCGVGDANRVIRRLNTLHLFIIGVSVLAFLANGIVHLVLASDALQSASDGGNWLANFSGPKQLALFNAISKGFLSGTIISINVDNLLFPAKRAALAYDPDVPLKRSSLFSKIVLIFSAVVFFILMQLYDTSSNFLDLGMQLPGSRQGLSTTQEFFGAFFHDSRVESALKVVFAKTLIYLLLVVEMAMQIKQMLKYPIRSMENRLRELNMGNARKVSAITIVSNDEFTDLFREVNTLIARQQAELDSSSRRLEALVTMAADPVISFNSKGGILVFNPAAERFFGWGAGESSGLNVARILEFPDNDPCCAEEAKAAREGTAPMGDIFGKAEGLRRLWAVRKSGERVLVESNVSSSDSGEATVYTAILRDVSAQVEIEESLKKAKLAAENANRLKSEFLANMSHELRTPLNAVLGFTQLLVTDKNLTESQLEKINIISRSGEHLLSLINDILDISKIEAGKHELHPTVFSPTRFVEDIHEMFSLRCKKAGLGFYVEYAGTLPERVRGDLGKLRQVMINLVGNAVKFTAEGGIGITVGPDAGKIRFSVTDTGKGIPKDELDAIMEPFAQASTNDEEGGTGLGLAISSRFIQMMGGRLDVESESGKGSVFSFAVDLPETDEALPEDKNENVAVAVKKGTEATVLIVDDKELNRLVLKEMLEGAGFLTMEAENGRIAVERTLEFRPALVFMDIKMPVMDGYEATKKIRETPEIAETPVFALTASAFVNDEEKILESGFDGFLAKPFKRSALFALIRDKSSVALEYETVEAVNAETVPDFDGLDFADVAARIGKDAVRALADSLMINDFTAIGTLADSLRDRDRDFAALVRYYAEGFDEEGLQRVLDALGS